MIDKVDKVTADSFLRDVRELALDCGVTLEEIKFKMPTGMRCDWNEWLVLGDGPEIMGEHE